MTYLTTNPEMEKTTEEFKIWGLGQVKNTKFGMGVRL